MDDNIETMTIEQLNQYLDGLDARRLAIREMARKAAIVRNRRITEAELNAKLNKLKPAERQLLAQQVKAGVVELGANVIDK